MDQGCGSSAIAPRRHQEGGGVTARQSWFHRVGRGSCSGGRATSAAAKVAIPLRPVPEHEGADVAVDRRFSAAFSAAGLIFHLAATLWAVGGERGGTGTGTGIMRASKLHATGRATQFTAQHTTNEWQKGLLCRGVAEACAIYDFPDAAAV